MKFLLDEDVYYATYRFLVDSGFDVVTAKEIGCAMASDTELLEKAGAQGRIFVTRDRDYGNLVFIRKIKTGVVYLRMPPSAIQEVHAEFERVLAQYSEKEVTTAFIVIEPGRHRFRRIQ